MKLIYFRVSSATTVFGSYKQYNVVMWKSLRNGLVNSSRRWNTLYVCSSPTRNLWTRRAKTLAKASSMCFNFLICRIFYNIQQHHLFVLEIDRPPSWAAIQLSVEDIVTFVNRHYSLSVKNVQYIKKAFSEIQTHVSPAF